MKKRLFFASSAFILSLVTLIMALTFDLKAHEESESLVVYCGRKQSLVEDLFKMFEKETGVYLQVKYGKTTPLAKTILEEGKNSPADVFFAQDAGALGALSNKGLLEPLPESVNGLVDSDYRSNNKDWIGVSGRARVVTYNTNKLMAKDLPETIWGFTDPKWKGRIGWPPSNASFHSFVTALRKSEGEKKARMWLEKIKMNEPKIYPKNTPAVDAVGRGEIDVAFVNHYYLYKFLKKNADFPARNHYFKTGDVGSLINVAGVGILKTSHNKGLATKFVAWLLSRESQQYFADKTVEYPLLAEGAVKTHPVLKPLVSVKQPDIDLNDLEDLEGTLKLLRDLEILK